MSGARPASGAGPLGALQRIAQAPPRPVPDERCDMCGTPVTDVHSHVVNVDTRALLCTCRACYLLFTAQDAVNRR